MASRPAYRESWAEVDLDAVVHNVGILRRVVAPAGVCAVVKADGYGHGAPAVARAALAAGAVGVAVALVEEVVELRQAGIGAPVLLLSEPTPDGIAAAVEAGAAVTVCTRRGVAAAASAARALGTRAAVQVTVDTGMHRMGAAPEDAAGVAAAVAADPSLLLDGLWTHLAVADGGSDEDRCFTDEQVRCFDRVVGALAARGIEPRVRHAANSAGAIAHPAARMDQVRAGIAVYGELPGPVVAAALAEASPDALRPVLSLRARVSAVRTLPAGARPSYGRHRPLPERGVVATVPLGYADGVPRTLFETGGEVLIGGRRCPLAGMVTMDQIVVDCGRSPVAVGDEVVLIGRQGDQAITATDWADRLGTISYEVLCGIGSRVPRVVLGAPGA